MKGYIASRHMSLTKLQTYFFKAYKEMFALVMEMSTMRAFISHAKKIRGPLHQLDVKGVFLHGGLQEFVYMEIPLAYSKTEVAEKEVY